MSSGKPRGILDPRPPPTDLLTTKQAARRLNVSESFLERDRWQGATIRFIRVGKRAVRYHPDDIAEYLFKKTGRSADGSRDPDGGSW